MKKGSKNNGSEDSIPELPFQVQEAYRELRTNIMYALARESNKKAIAISSALHSEGKSITSANLAVVMAQTDARVLLIDADMRKPKQHKIFNMSNDKGLSSILGGFTSFSNFNDVIFAETTVKKSPHVMPAGKAPPNPSELLGSDRMTHLIEKLSEYYDYIFIDTPPINIVTDAIVLVKKVAGIALVTRHNQSKYKELARAISKLELADANILGLVVNAVREKSSLFGNYYGYKYGNYGYGENATKK